MRVNIYEQLDITDEERHAIAAHYDGPGQKKRLAKRDEIKDYVWQRGAKWRDYIGNPAIREAEHAEASAESDAEDLLGTGPTPAPAAAQALPDDVMDLL